MVEMNTFLVITVDMLQKKRIYDPDPTCWLNFKTDFFLQIPDSDSDLTKTKPETWPASVVQTAEYPLAVLPAQLYSSKGGYLDDLDP